MLRAGAFLLVGTSVTASIDKTITIAPGVEMPLINIGICNHSQAVQVGARGLDTAFSYGDNDQRDIGQTVRNSGLKRSELFVLSKIPCCPASQFWGVGVQGCNQGHRNPSDDLNHDMDMLGLDNVDLMLMHWPCDNMDDNIATYKQMEKFMQAGKARAIGVSNFNGQMLEELVSKTSIKPAVNQVGFSIGNHAKQPEGLPSRQHWGCDDETLAKCKELGTTLMAFSPLGGHGFFDVMGDETVKSVASAKGRSSAQVGLRWLAQQGIAFVTSSNNPDHIKADFEIFDFELSDDDMKRLSSVNRPDIPSPTPSPPPPSPPSPPSSWKEYKGYNCYGQRGGSQSHGAKDMENPASASCGTMSLSDCQQKCEQMQGCTGVTVRANNGRYDCFRKGDIQPDQCDKNSQYDTYSRLGVQVIV